MKFYKIKNWIKRNIGGVIIEYGKVNRVGFKAEDEYYIDRIKYRFGKPVAVRRYWDEKEFKENKKVERKPRTVVKGFVIK